MIKKIVDSKNNPMVRMVRFIYKMERIIVILVLLQLAKATGQEFAKEDYLSNSQYDVTVDQVKQIYDVLQSFDKQTITKIFNEWTSQNKMFDTSSPVIIESEKVAVYFSKFIPDEVIVPIPHLTNILAAFDQWFQFTFENTPNDLQVEGNIRFIRSGNDSSLCEIFFKLDCKLSVVTFMIRNMENPKNVMNKEVDLMSVLIEKKNFTQTKLDEKTCVGINETQRQSIFNYVKQAMENAVGERIKLAKKSVFQSMSDKWLNSIKNPNRYEGKRYSRFKTECNTVMSPGIFDYNEVIIEGLNNIGVVFITYLPTGKTTYGISLQYNAAKILWNFASMAKMQLNFDVRIFSLGGTVNELLDDLKVLISGILRIEPHSYTTNVDEETKKSLEILIADGIKRTMRKIKYDRTKDFSNALSKILRPFDTLHSFINFEKEQETTTYLRIISFSKIGIEAFHLGNITWSQYNNSKIGVGNLVYKEMKGHANFSYPVRKDNILLATVPVSASVYIKEAIFEISLEYYLNSTNKAAEVRINDNNFSNTDATIMIESNHYRLHREDRIAIGKVLSKNFVEIIRTQIFNVTKSTFRPIFDICENSLHNTIAKAGSSNHFDDDERYIAAIRDCWGNKTACGSTRPVDMIIAGSWNFESINARYNNKKVVVDGIKLENVTANIKQFGDTNKTIVRNYSMEYLSLIINHTDNEIIVKVPAKVILNSIYSNSSNNSSPSQAEPNIPKQFESTVASFYRNTIYKYLEEDPNYRAKFREIANEIMTKTKLEDAPSAYDVSSLFISSIVEKLREKKHPFLDFGENSYYTSISSNSDYISMATKHRVETRNAEIFVGEKPARSNTLSPLSQEEICISNHSQNTDNIVEHLILNGTVHTFNTGTRFMVQVPFSVTGNRIMNTSGHYYNENERVHIDDKNMNDFYLLENQTSIFEPSNEVMTTEIALMTSSFLRSRLEEFSYIRSFCQSAFNSTHFMTISNIIDYPFQRFSMYHIKLYGLHNLKLLRMRYSINFTEFEITVTNLTARIIWSHYLSDIVLQAPQITEVQIWNISLRGIILDTNRLIFSDRSKLQISDQGNSTMMNKLKETLGSIATNSIQQSIQQKYNEIQKN